MNCTCKQCWRDYKYDEPKGAGYSPQFCGAFCDGVCNGLQRSAKEMERLKAENTKLQTQVICQQARINVLARRDAIPPEAFDAEIHRLNADEEQRAIWKEGLEHDNSTLRRLLGEACEAAEEILDAHEVDYTRPCVEMMSAIGKARAFLSGEQPAEPKAPRNLLAGTPVTVQFISDGIRGSAHVEQPKAEGGEAG